MTDLIGSLLRALGDVIVRVVQIWRKERADKTIGEIEDEQAKTDAADRGGASGVLERLRKRGL